MKNQSTTGTSLTWPDQIPPFAGGKRFSPTNGIRSGQTNSDTGVKTRIRSTYVSGKFWCLVHACEKDNSTTDATWKEKNISTH